MMHDLLSEDIQCRLQGCCLFYPSSAADLVEPVQLFAPCIKSFWFVDVGYFGEPGAVHRAKPALHASRDFQFLSVEIRENLIPESDWRNDFKYRVVGPCIRSETYKHLQSGTLIVVHRHRRRGPTALRNLREPLGVFFYRGDSMEGSRTMWLTAATGRRPSLFSEVLDALVGGGLIATDGSNCMHRWGGVENPYRHFAEVADSYCTDAKAVGGFSFSDREGRCFQLLGCAASRCERPTLLWQVSF